MRNSRFGRLFMMLASLGSSNIVLPQYPFDLDTSFRTSIAVRNVVDVFPLSDGTLLVSGKLVFTGDDPLLPRYGARLFQDGNQDQSFEDYPGMGGKLTRWNEQFYAGAGQLVLRLNIDGSLDPTFIGMNNGPYFTSLQGGDYHVFPDGRVLMSGAHLLSDTERGFEGLYSLIWFSNEGYLDTTRIHRYCDQVIYDIEEQPDGKFLCTGTMSTFEDQPVSRIFRVQPDGALDPSFAPPLQPWGGAYDYETLPDGRILVGGFVRLEGSDQIRCLVRFLPNGEVDPSFNLIEFDATFQPTNLPYVLNILRIDEDRYVVTGVFDRVNGQIRGGIAMVDGSGDLIDGVFDGTGCGAYDYVEPSGSFTYKYIGGIVPSPDGNYYIYGGYHGYDDGTTNDPTQRMVSRLYGLDVGMQERPAFQMAVYPNPTNTLLTVCLERVEVNNALVLRDAMGREVLRQRNTGYYTRMDVSGLATGVYTLELRTSGMRLAMERVVVQR